MLVLVVGDAHIPERAECIPEPIRKLLQPGRIDQVVSLGNVSDATTLTYLNKLSPSSSMISVLGSADIPDTKSQTSATFSAGKFRIGVISSFLVVPVDDIDVLSGIARKLNVDILLWGGNHQQETQNWASHYFVNPGSLTGAVPDTDGAEVGYNAGFSLLDIGTDECTLFMYQLDGTTVKVEKAQLPYISRSS